MSFRMFFVEGVKDLIQGLTIFFAIHQKDRALISAGGHVGDFEYNLTRFLDPDSGQKHSTINDVAMDNVFAIVCWPVIHTHTSTAVESITKVSLEDQTIG